jgi:hypothetical protein
MHWGLLGPEHLAGSRRTRALGLGSAVRQFNQLAVPGLGGVWFAKQLFLATLGVIVADRLRMLGTSVKTIEIANAIEALACWGAFESNGWTRDARLRGIQKLFGKQDLTFSKLRQTRFYVTQPMRMATVEALVDLGFVHPGSQRFNSFRCTSDGQDFVDTVTTHYKPFRVSIEDYLVRLAKDNSPIVVTAPLRDALSPLEQMDTMACDLVRSRLCQGAGNNNDASRRKNAITWVSSMQPGIPADWSSKPPQIEADHWEHLRSGAHFFKARDAAIDVLNAIEATMSSLHTAKISTTRASEIPAIEKSVSELRRAAKAFLAERVDPTEGQLATDFCRSCTDTDVERIIRSLVLRDNRVLLIRGDDILPGPAYVGRPQTDDPDEDAEGPGVENADRVPVPDGISSRIHNLYLLEKDLSGELSTFLKPVVPEVAA